MPANVTESRVEVWNDTLGIRLDTPRKTTGYTAWCDECMSGAVNWRGNTFAVGYFSAPTLEAVIEAEAHNDAEHAKQRHIVRVSELIRCDYCGDVLPNVKSRAHIPTTPDLQRMGFAADKVVCPECVTNQADGSRNAHR